MTIRPTPRAAARVLVPLVLLLPSVVGVAWAHRVDHEVSRAEATVITLRYADGSPFAFEECEIRRDGEDAPFLVGRTDAEGRLAFLPPSDGSYHARALSADGHGATFHFETAGLDTGVSAGGPENGAGRGILQVLAGVALILVLFALLRLFVRRSSSTASTEGDPS